MRQLGILPLGGILIIKAQAEQIRTNASSVLQLSFMVRCTTSSEGIFFRTVEMRRLVNQLRRKKPRIQLLAPSASLLTAILAKGKKHKNFRPLSHPDAETASVVGGA
jgi:hypothetical protein